MVRPATCSPLKPARSGSRISLRERIAAPQRLEGDRLCRHGDDGRGYYGARSNCLELALNSTSTPESLRSGS